MKVAGSAEMREMDRRTIEEFGVPGILLMENAALRVAEEIARRFKPAEGAKIALICGKGNNGGDGLAIARHLATRCRAAVTIWLVADPAQLSNDALTNYRIAKAFGLPVRLADRELPSDFPGELAKAQVIIDALFGTGITGAVTGTAAAAIEAMNASGRPIVSVDIPSGLDADTGSAAGACVRAALTVTFALPKYGLLVHPGLEYAGELLVTEIGMPPAVMQADAIQVFQTEPADIVRWLPSRDENRDSNKGKFGHVTVVAGSSGFVGAAALSSEAAARTGAGLVTLAVPEGIWEPAMSHVSPVVMTRGFAQTEGHTFSAAAADAVLALAAKGTAAALGPGLGGVADTETRAFVREFVARCIVPLVIDADALTILAQEPDSGVALVQGRAAPTVLTPHPGEMGRLLGLDSAAVQADRRAAVQRAARDYRCTVLLKGARTLVASPNGALHLNPTSNPGMATGGSGDVLTGVIAALLAQRLDAHAAAAAGAYLHGLAGDLFLQENGGADGLIASDLPARLPRAIAHCRGMQDYSL